MDWQGPQCQNCQLLAAGHYCRLQSAAWCTQDEPHGSPAAVWPGAYRIAAVDIHTDAQPLEGVDKAQVAARRPGRHQVAQMQQRSICKAST